MSSKVNKLLNIMPIVALGLPVITAWTSSGGDVGAFIDKVKSWYFGQQPTGEFRISELPKGWAPLIISILIVAGVKMVPKLVNSITKAFK